MRHRIRRDAPHDMSGAGIGKPELLRAKPQTPIHTPGRRGESPLRVYLEQTGINGMDFARVTGIPKSNIYRYINGEVPSLVEAYEIEIASKGIVPMESWVGTQEAVDALEKIRAGQPPEAVEAREALLGALVTSEKKTKALGNEELGRQPQLAIWHQNPMTKTTEIEASSEPTEDSTAPTEEPTDED